MSELKKSLSQPPLRLCGEFDKLRGQEPISEDVQ